MDNDVINEMNREIGVGSSLDVDDNQMFEYLREEHDRDEEKEEDKK